MRRLCTFSAWDRRSWPQMGRYNRVSRGHTKINIVEQIAYRSSYLGLEQSWTMESTSVLTSMPRTTRKTPAYTTLLPQAWRHALRWVCKTVDLLMKPIPQVWHFEASWSKALLMAADNDGDELNRKKINEVTPMLPQMIKTLAFCTMCISSIFLVCGLVFSVAAMLGNKQ